MRKFSLLACAVLALVVSGGCANQKPNSAEPESFAKKLISEKVAIAAGAQRDYAALLAEDYSTIQRRQASFSADTVDIDYIGSPKELVQTVAARYGYAFRETGKPIDLRPVNIRMKGVTPEEILRNVGNQIDSGGDVVLDKGVKAITIQYKNRDGADRRNQS